MKLELRTGNLNELRKANFVPGVIYGKTMESTSVQVEKNELMDALAQYGRNMTFKVRLDSKYHFVYFKSVESRVLKPTDILHFSLHRITPTETISATIPIEMIGKEAFYSDNIYPELVMQQVEAEYVAGQGVHSIKIDISKMKLGESILVKDLVVTEGLTLKEDPMQVVVIIKESSLKEEVIEPVVDTVIETAVEE